MSTLNLTLLTDLYELTMMQGYFKNHNQDVVVFDAFYRNNPCDGGYSVCAGLAQVIDYIENLHFDADDINYLRSLKIFDEDFLEYLSNFKFSGDIYAVPEGSLIFPREPLVKVVAPIMEAQLIETAILNIVNHQCLIATKAARVCYAAKGDNVMEFGLRRAQGPDSGIRMDSGDLAYLSKQVRKMLDEAGFPDAVISASNDLDEYLIESLKLQGAAISSWGVGTNLITSKDNPAFGGVYKLAAIRTADGSFQPKIKLSENVEKVTNPGNKTFYRVYDKKTGKIKADLICLYDETFDESEDLKLFDPNAPWKKTRLPGGSYTLREMLIPVIKAGKTIYTSPGVMEIREICNHEKDTIWDETKRFVNPQEIYVDLSQKLYDMKTALLNEMSMDS